MSGQCLSTDAHHNIAIHTSPEGMVPFHIILFNDRIRLTSKRPKEDKNGWAEGLVQAATQSHERDDGHERSEKVCVVVGDEKHSTKNKR